MPPPAAAATTSSTHASARNRYEDFGYFPARPALPGRSAEILLTSEFADLVQFPQTRSFELDSRYGNQTNEKVFDVGYFEKLLCIAY